MKCFLFLIFVFGITLAHDEYRGKCPDFKSMEGFDWEKVNSSEYFFTGAGAAGATSHRTVIS